MESNRKEKKKQSEEREQEEEDQAHSDENGIKASCIVGIGPITTETLKHFEDISDNFEIAKEQAVIEFLKFYLKYDNIELHDLNIVSTQIAPKDDIIYVAFDNTKDVRDIYKKIAQVKHPDVTTRNFVPPQFYAWYMYLSKVCKYMRDTDKEIKTQIRFGKTDVEILTKKKGEGEPFKIIDIASICKIEDVPKFDDSKIWNKKNYTADRNRKAQSPAKGKPPSMCQDKIIHPLSRTSSLNTAPKKK